MKASSPILNFMLSFVYVREASIKITDKQGPCDAMHTSHASNLLLDILELWNFVFILAIKSIYSALECIKISFQGLNGKTRFFGVKI